MSITSKYDFRADESTPQSAMHKRLGRQVTVLAIDKSIDPVRVRSVASRMSKLDHAAIPTLLDFTEDRRHQYLVLESCESATTNVPQNSGLGQLDRLDKVAHAMSHARAHQIVHGDLGSESIHVDAQGEPKIVGLGMRQCVDTQVDVHALAMQDLQAIRRMVSNCLRQRTPAASAENDVEDQETIGQLLESEWASIHDFSNELRRVLQVTRAAHAARELDFASNAPSDHSVRFRSATLILATVAIVLLSATLSFLLWPRSDATVANVDNGGRRQHDDQDQRLKRPLVDSNLANVGVLNQERPISESTEEDSPSPERASDLGDRPPTDAPKATPGSRQPPESRSASIPDPPTKKRSPFVDIPASIELPDVRDARATQLVVTSLSPEQPLELSLLGGEHAARQGSFTLRSGEDANEWFVEYENKGVNSRVGGFRRADATLEFRWLVHAPLSIGALCNSILELGSGDRIVRTALRRPIDLPPFHINLERVRSYQMEVDHLPNMRTVTIEFAPQTETLSKPLSNPTINAANEAMRIGLEAGEDSLFALQLDASDRGRMKPTVFYRPSMSAKWQIAKRGFSQKLRQSMQTTNQQLFVLKRRLQSLKGKEAAKARKRIELSLQELERKQKQTERFVDSYLAARSSTLHFQVYQRIGEHKLLLARIGGNSTD